MMYFSAFLYFAFGAIIGSFLNVFVLRHNTGKRITGRSACASCQHRLQWFELVPIISWVVQGGKCTACGSRISVQYPIVELSTGVLFFIGSTLGLYVVSTALYFAIVSILIAIAVYDIKHTIIPDTWVYAFAVLALLFSFTLPQVDPTFVDILLRVCVGIALAAPFALVWLVSKGAWMGLGDAKLMFGIGILLGFEQAFFAILISFVVGAVAGLFLIFLSSDFSKIVRGFTPTLASKRLVRGFTMKSEIPFGPFLIGVSFVVWIANLHGVFANLNLINEGLALLSFWW